ncbi:AarF/ABC1/UbiB kinase family protein [Sulfurovum sp.]|uniref:ABC1 kinase family protein n=1 Tax=Sulfurovum sp. TaxID=1969726 RepID=UPI0025F8C34B|nr:AarF/ABC1/UbiB kinase family protein [Sulfurovum sp.]
MFDTLLQAERTKTIVAVLVKNGFHDIVNVMGVKKYIKFSIPKTSQQELKLSRSEHIRKTVEELGPTFIKMAQILSTRPDLIPLELADEFSKLQDNVEAMPFAQMRSRFVEEFGKDANEIFEGKLTLIASASLGQVYKGQLKSGEEVAVKVLRPGTQKMIRSDIQIMYHIASLLEDRLYSYGIDSPTKIVEEFEKTIKKELDYNTEALSLKRFSRNFEGNERILVPKLYEAYSGSTVLTMEFVKGIKVTDTEKLEENGIDPREVAKSGFDLICEQIFEHRFFHADPHPGNIFALPDGRISFVDFGMMGSIAERNRKDFVDMIYYIVKEEEEKAAFCILKLAKVENDNLDTDAFAKDMGDVIRTYFYGSLKDIKIKNLINDVVALMSRHKVYFKENNYLLTKALITIEGVGKILDPDFNAAEEIKPFVLRFYKENFSFSTFLSRAGEMPKEFGDFLVQFPQDIKSIVEKMKSGKLKIEFQHMGLEEMEESIEKSANRLSISIIIAAILIGSALLLLAKTPPMIFGIPILGLAGFVTAVGMGIVLIRSIYKKGRL